MSDRRQLTLYGIALIATVLSTELDVLNRMLDTTSLTGGQWLVCIVLALALLAVEEGTKTVLRHREAADGHQHLVLSTDVHNGEGGSPTEEEH